MEPGSSVHAIFLIDHYIPTTIVPGNPCQSVRDLVCSKCFSNQEPRPSTTNSPRPFIASATKEPLQSARHQPSAFAQYWNRCLAPQFPKYNCIPVTWRKRYWWFSSVNRSYYCLMASVVIEVRRLGRPWRPSTGWERRSITNNRPSLSSKR